MKYKFVLAIGILTLFSCKQQRKEQTMQSEIVNDTAMVKVSEKQQNKIVSAQFLSLVQHIDSTGYISDTLRYTPEKSIKHPISGYIFFEMQKEYTAPFFAFAIKEHDEEEMEQHEDSAFYLVPPYFEQMKDYDIKPLEKVQLITHYYFKQKQPQIIDGQKWYTDGNIEEWTFENEEQAKQATQMMMNAPLCIIYFNTCSFICCKENRMYIFFARASAFMYTQKEFFNWFVKQNNITLFLKPNI